MRCQDWIHNPKTTHTKRFHWDEKSLPQDPHVFVDSGRPFPGQPPLLTTRLHLKAAAAEQLWLSLLQGGWPVCRSGTLKRTFRTTPQIERTHRRGC